MCHRRRPSVALGRAFTVLLWSAAATAPAADEHIEFDHLSLEEGLSQSIIEQIVQDRKGFMWFVTEDGLNRFDGYRFVVVRNEPGDPSSLSHNELKSIHEDRDGILWVGAFEGGLNRYDPSTGKVTRYRNDPADPASLSHDTVRVILEDRAGRLWIGTEGGGLDRLDRASGRFDHYLTEAHTPGSRGGLDVRALLEDRSGALWVGTNGAGLYRLDPETGALTRFRHEVEDRASLAGDAVFALLEDRGGTLWVGTYGAGLDAFDPSSGTFTHHRADPSDPTSLGSDLVKALCEDHTGALWVATDGGGLSRFDPERGTFTSFHHDPMDPRSLSTDRLYSVYEDRSSVLWVGTYGGGLNTFDVARKRFRTVRSDPGDPNSLDDDIVWTFAEHPPGVLWIGTDSGGLNRFDRASKRWRHWVHDPDDPSSLAHNTVRMLHVDPDGVLWIATNGGGLDRFDPARGEFRHFRHDPDDPGSLAHDSLRSVFRDSAGRLWVGTFGGGLDLLDEAGGRFVHHRHDPRDPFSISNDYIRLVAEDRDGVLWIGTQGGGLNRLDPASGRFSHYRSNRDDPTSISNDHVFAIHEDRAGTLWLGTFGGGLNRFDRARGTFTRYLTEDGLVSDALYAMLEDEDGRLWISSTRGLSRFDPGTETFVNYDVRDGLQSNEFNGGAAYSSPSGEMFFGGIAGFNAFFPSEIGVNTRVPNVVLTDLQLFNHSVSPGERVRGRVLLERPLAYTDRIELSYKDNVITIEFAALHYSAPTKNLYSYRMEGFSDSWIPVGAHRRSATFTGLEPGDYVFRVRGSNSDGVWNTAGAALRIRITPPFWATWWFRLAGLLVLAGVAMVAVQVRTRDLRMRAQLAAAHDAQVAIIPQADPEMPGFDVAGAWIPAYGVGGDFFDYLWLEGDPPRLAIVVGDVAGKGMLAAMNAVMSDGMVVSRARQSGSVQDIMSSLNRSLYHKVSERMFTAMCLVVLDPATRDLTFVNAGLCEPLHRSDGRSAYLSSPGPRLPLGGMEHTRYESRTLRLEPGDVVALFSDGIPETRDRSGELYGYDAPRDLLAGLDTGGMSADAIKAALIEDAQRFRRGAPQSDDVVLVVIKAVDQAL